MARTSIHAPWTVGPVYGSRAPSPERWPKIIHGQCKRNAVHLFKTAGWVIDVGPIKYLPSGFAWQGIPVQYLFEIDGFTKPVAGERDFDRLPERFTFDVYMSIDPTFDLHIAIPAKMHVPDVVLRCLSATFNELGLHHEAQLARRR